MLKPSSAKWENTVTIVQTFLSIRTISCKNLCRWSLLYKIKHFVCVLDFLLLWYVNLISVSSVFFYTYIFILQVYIHNIQICVKFQSCFVSYICVPSNINVYSCLHKTGVPYTTVSLFKAYCFCSSLLSFGLKLWLA